MCGNVSKIITIDKHFEGNAQVVKKMTSKAALLPEEREAHIRLKKIWNERKRDRHLNQYGFADKYGTTQSNVNQYLNGYKPLNIKYCIYFATELGIDPKEIYPELFAGLKTCAPPEDPEFFRLYGNCTPAQKQAIKQMMIAMQSG